MFPSGGVLPRPHELSASFPSGLSARPPYETAPIPAGFLAGPPSHIGMCHNLQPLHSLFNDLLIDIDIAGSSVSPFGRYSTPFNNFPGLAFGRDIPIGTPLQHDPWRK